MQYCEINHEKLDNQILDIILQMDRTVFIKIYCHGNIWSRERLYRIHSSSHVQRKSVRRQMPPGKCRRRGEKSPSWPEPVSKTDSTTGSWQTASAPEWCVAAWIGTASLRSRRDWLGFWPRPRTVRAQPGQTRRNTRCPPPPWENKRQERRDIPGR